MSTVATLSNPSFGPDRVNAPNLSASRLAGNMFFCAISGVVPTDPVVARPSGHVYERRLIEKYIAENGTDPITGGKLETDDIIAIKANPSSAPPRPPNFTSVPAILNALQNEWDALVLETFTLRQQYNATRQELSHALYQQDAATRVVARLLKERDSAREALATVQSSMGIAPTDDVEMAADSASVVPEDTVAIINDTLNTLSSTRMKRKMVAEYATVENVRAFEPKQSIPSLHASSPAGINSIVLSQTTPDVFATAGNDKTVQIYDASSQKVLHTLKGHTKKVNHVAWREADGETSLILSASADKTARVWGYDDGASTYAPKQTFKTHKGDVVGLGVHPSNKLVALASADKTFSLHDLTTFQTVYQSEQFDVPFHSLAFHPDGHFIGIGTSNGAVIIVDLRTGAPAATLASEAGEFTVDTVAFSENGWQMAAPGSPEADVVALWDLRKQKARATLDVGGGFKIRSLAFDYSAAWLGVGGAGGLKLFTPGKVREEIWSTDGEVVDLAFGPLGKSVWAVGGREVRIWGA
ncbi:Pre-mRNA-processing factor 19 {ECO:0000305} {ECO:0000250/UniProtKB:Q9UMS4}; AltName: Full=PRP19/PSO4 homolog [Serendipita indica DSM 11827]|nr:Pre-mRNA-processing factor 19 {ECO:0000305} {ECO:0000250/UniProtKB:Q9UMS4}; AltName: Full=PRP19/PSO4 homolog [Serendipita indica DSM 11827]